MQQKLLTSIYIWRGGVETYIAYANSVEDAIDLLYDEFYNNAIKKTDSKEAKHIAETMSDFIRGRVPIVINENTKRAMILTPYIKV